MIAEPPSYGATHVIIKLLELIEVDGGDGVSGGSMINNLLLRGETSELPNVFVAMTVATKLDPDFKENGAAFKIENGIVHILSSTIALFVPSQLTGSVLKVPSLFLIAIVYAVMGMPVLMGAVHVMVALTYKLAVIIGAFGV